tara:strand:- start:558 stop:7826 length:7269 start_codon:yes stop_codon:yes gene_type:complete
MPQKTNLNISPYYDDFSKDNQFYRVLFNPGRPVQARELTTLQSILQDQVESFGSHMFKEGSMVIPGNTSYDYEYYSVKVQSDHLGVPVSGYLQNLKGKVLQGQESGIRIKVDNFALPEDSADITDLTLFVKYLDSGTNNEVSFMTDAENLIVEESFIYGNTQITAGETVASLIDQDASSVGSAVSIADGVFFIRGHFVNVSSDKIVLDPYTNTPSYRVGLFIQEEIVQAKDDPSLFDNARGFSNFAAPGADRLKIRTTLTKKPLTDYNDKNFVELLRLDNGQLKKSEQKPDYSLIKDYFAKRTYEESGNYSVGNFDVEVTECLNDGVSNEGVFLETEQTDQRNTPEESLMCVKVSPGKAYVRGHDIEKSGTSVIDVDKPRDKEEFKDAKVNFKLGTLFKLNNVHGTPEIGLNNNYANSTILLRNLRKGSGNNPGPAGAGAGGGIGRARIYAFENTDAAYKDATTQFDLYLYDIQLFTKITVNVALSNSELPVGSFVEGLSSGATGFAVSAGGNNTDHSLDQVSGTFIEGEQVRINGDNSLTRSITTVLKNGLEDVMSVAQEDTFISGADFSGDLVLKEVPIKELSPADRVNVSGSNMICAGKTFDSLKVNDILISNTSTAADPSFSRITAISADLKTVTLAAATAVTGVNSASIATGGAPIRKGVPQIFLNDAGLYAELQKKNVSDVSLAQSKLFIKSQVEKSASSNSLVVNISDVTDISSATFATFDADRYSISKKTTTDTRHQTLEESQVVLSNNNTTITFNNIDNGAKVVNVTLEKDLISQKSKNISRSNSIVINKTNAGIATHGLTTATGYGLRVQDKEISLNTPEVFNVTGVFESVNNADPILDKLVFVSGLALNSNTILGERIKGASSGAIAVLAGQTNATTVEIVKLTQSNFIIGESITFDESNITANLQGTIAGLFKDVSTNYILDDGQRDEYSDYSRIVRKDGSTIPSKRIRVIFDKFTVPSNDTGDVFTVGSYPANGFKNVPILSNGLRASDTLDFRPKVADYTGSSSPFAFESRAFDASGSNPTLVVAPNEASTLDFKFFLPRIDKLILDASDSSDNAYTSGEFQIIKGVSSQNPIVPADVETAMTIGTIELPAYLYDTDDVKITLVDNRRYTMRDIGGLEDRIETLEELTSLSLLELDTKTLQIQDADGLSRFKTGFFVDDFKNTNLLDRLNPDCKCDVISSSQQLVTPTDFYSVKPELALDVSLNSSTADFSQNLALLDSGVRKTGDLITLDYDEVTMLEQPLASRVENVNPFNIVTFRGRMILSPSADTWTRNVILDDGTRTVLGDTNETFTNDRIVSSVPDTHIRSRNVAFNASSLKPTTRFYPFFDSASGIDVIPKLIEVSMDSGSFDVNETVEGFDGATRVFVARTCAPNHKTGSISSPTTVYTQNPYNSGLTLPSLYSASSTVLNIDISGLVEEAQGRFFGYIETGIKLVGSTSGATATVSNIRLISDTLGDLNGSFFFRDPLATPVPQLRFTNGTKTFKLTSSATNSRPLLGSPSISEVEQTYRTSGVVDTFRQSTVVVRIPPPPPQPVVFNITNVTEEITQNITNVTEVTNVTNVTQNVRNVTEVVRETVRVVRVDPLAQSFTVDESGAFLTSVDLFFKSKDVREKLTVQIRTVELGIPTLVLLQDYAQVVLEPSQVNVSDDASVATRVTFPSPVYLEGGQEYAVVLLSPSSDNYEAWIGRMGESTIETQSLPDAESVVISKQYIGGSLFKSQNGSIWTASQFEDLKFTLNKADFSKSRDAEVIFYNPELNYESSLIPTLGNNAIRTLPRKMKVKIDTGATASEIAVGKRIGAGVAGVANTTPNGVVERLGGVVSGESLEAGGSGYKASLSGQTASTFNITGNGTGLTLDVSSGSDGVMTGAAINAAGSGYSVGDLVGIVTSTLGAGQQSGSGAVFSIDSISATDTLYLTDVQGQTFSNNAALLHFNGTNFVALTGNKLVDGTVNTPIDALHAGNVIEITQYNHGMHSGNNKLEISNIQPDTQPVILNAAVGLSTSVLLLDDPASGANATLPFAEFEGKPTTSGFVKVNNEIMKYTTVDSSNESLYISERGISGTAIREHAKGSLVYKYELNGFSLTGINTDHQLPSTSLLRTQSDIDKYYIEVPRSAGRVTGDDMMNFFTDSFGGGNQIFVSQNIQFNQIYPRFNHITPGQTALSARTRTISGTSAGGSEVSFLDQGFEDVQLNTINTLSTPRLVASPINETERLDDLPLNRSNTLSIRLLSGDKNLSPVIDTMNGSIIYIRNRLNKPVDDYALDSRVKLNSNDPHAGVYISNRVDLKQPATSLQVLINAQKAESADFRVMYKLFNSEIPDGEQSYDLFPGFDNLLDTDGDGFGDQVINAAQNSGRPDAKVGSSVDGEFLEYQFTADNLSEFTGFVIKVVFSGTNEAEAPRLNDLRAIALA